MKGLRCEKALFWSFTMLAGGSIIGMYYFPQFIILAIPSICFAGYSFNEIDKQLSKKILKYETPIDDHQLVAESFPKPLTASKKIDPNDCKKPHVAKNKQQIILPNEKSNSSTAIIFSENKKPKSMTINPHRKPIDNTENLKPTTTTTARHTEISRSTIHVDRKQSVLTFEISDDLPATPSP